MVAEFFKKPIVWKSCIYSAIFFVAFGSILLLAKVLIDPNRWKPRVEALVAQKLIAQVSLGKFELYTLEGIGLRIQDITVKEGDKTLISLPELSIKLSVLSLFRLRPSWTIYFSKPEVLAVVEQDGLVNLTKIIKPIPDQAENDGVTKKGFIYKLLASSVYDLKVGEGHIKFRHEPKNTETELQNVNISLKKASSGQPMDFFVKTHLTPFKWDVTTVQGDFSSFGKATLFSLNPLHFNFKAHHDFTQMKFSIKEDVFQKDINQNFHIDTVLDYDKGKNTFGGEFQAKLLELFIQGKFRPRLIEFETSPFDTARFHSFFGVLRQHHVSGNVQAKLSISGDAWQERKASFVVKELSLIPPSIADYVSIEDRIVVNGQHEFSLMDQSIQEWRGSGEFNLSAAGIKIISSKIDSRRRGNDISPIFLKNKNISFLVQGAFQYHKESGFFIKEFHSTLDLWTLTLLKEGKITTQGEKTLEIQTSAIDLKTLKTFFPAISEVGISQGLLNPTVFSLKDNKLVSDVTFQNLKGDIQKIPLAFKKDIQILGQYDAGGVAQFVMEDFQLSQLEGKINANLKESEITYKDFFHKKRNGELHIQSGVSYKENEWKIESQIIFPQIEIRGKGIYSAKNMNLHFETTESLIEGVQDLSPKLQSFGFREGHVQVKASLQGSSLLPQVDIEARLKKIEADIPKGKEIIKEVYAEGPVQFDADIQVSMEKNHTQLKSVSAFLVLTAAKMKYRDIFNKEKGMPMNLKVVARPEAQETVISEGTLTFLNIPFKISGTLKDLSQNIFDFKVTANVPDISSLQGAIPFLKKVDGRGQISLDGSLSHAASQAKVSINQALTLKDVSFKVDAIKPRVEKVAGAISIEGESVSFKNVSLKAGSTDMTVYGSMGFGKPHGTVSVVSQNFNFDELFPQASKTLAAKQEGQSLPSRGPQNIVDLIKTSPFFKDLQLTGKLNFKKGTFSQYGFSDFSASILFKNLMFQLSQFDMKMYDGKIAAKSTVYFQNPSYTFEGAVANLDIGQLLTVKNPQLAEDIQGSFSTHCVLRGESLTWDSFKRNALGSGKLIVTNGKFSKLNLISSVLDTLRIFGAKVPPDLDLSGNFDSLTGNFELLKGAVTTENLLLDARDYFVTLTGDFNLDTRINYKGKYAFKEKGYGFPIYMDISGTISKPQVHPDVQEYVKSVITGVITDIFN